MEQRKLEAKVGWYFIKTPDTIYLYVGETHRPYNTETGEYDKEVAEKIPVPSLVGFMSKGKQFEEYGSREKEIIVVRFNHEVPKFDKAEWRGNQYRYLEETQAKNKRAYRLERVAE